MALGRHLRRWWWAPSIAAVLLGLPATVGSAVGVTRAGDSGLSRQSLSDDCLFADGVFVHGSRHGRDVALTFDACPTHHVPGFSPAIVDVLAREGVPATFFISGAWAKAHPHELEVLTRSPSFEIAMHGNRHRHLDGASERAVRSEVDDGRAALERLGVEPEPLFRPPYGDHPRSLAAVARAAGVTPVLWDVVTGDPSPAVTAADIERTVVTRSKPGSIVVMHVNGRGVGTAAALPAVIAGLRQRGLGFTTVGALLRTCRESPATNGNGEPQ